MTARRPLVGWYLHHQGAGHRTRFESVRRELDADVIVFSTLPPPQVVPEHTLWVMLDRDDEPERLAGGDRLDPVDADPTAGGSLHWAPVGHSGHASRLGAIAASLTSQRFDCFVVDVSVEVTLLVRLFGVPVVVVAQPGERKDAPHQLAYSLAERIIAPWPKALYAPRSLEPFGDAVRFVGGISRFDGRASLAGGGGAGGGADAGADAGSVLLLVGAGGAAVGPEDVEAAAVASSGTVGSSWTALGMPAT
ncbi:MAG: hypothetical protein JWR01_736, partial [Subtercola sp.]|nr:hypothetical protein [Subtercola sp.]